MPLPLPPLSSPFSHPLPFTPPRPYQLTLPLPSPLLHFSNHTTNSFSFSFKLIAASTVSHRASLFHSLHHYSFPLLSFPSLSSTSFFLFLGPFTSTPLIVSPHSYSRHFPKLQIETKIHLKKLINSSKKNKIRHIRLSKSPAPEKLLALPNKLHPLKTRHESHLAKNPPSENAMS